MGGGRNVLGKEDGTRDQCQANNRIGTNMEKQRRTWSQCETEIHEPTNGRFEFNLRGRGDSSYRNDNGDSNQRNTGTRWGSNNQWNTNNHWNNVMENKWVGNDENVRENRQKGVGYPGGSNFCNAVGISSNKWGTNCFNDRGNHPRWGNGYQSPQGNVNGTLFWNDMRRQGAQWLA